MLLSSPEQGFDDTTVEVNDFATVEDEARAFVEVGLFWAWIPERSVHSYDDNDIVRVANLGPWAGSADSESVYGARLYFAEEEAPNRQEPPNIKKIELYEFNAEAFQPELAPMLGEASARVRATITAGVDGRLVADEPEAALSALEDCRRLMEEELEAERGL